MDPRDWTYDRRVIKRNIKKAVFTVKELQDHLGRLPDASENAEILSIEQFMRRGALEARPPRKS